jgi:hypothetical protein
VQPNCSSRHGTAEQAVVCSLAARGGGWLARSVVGTSSGSHHRSPSPLNAVTQVERRVSKPNLHLACPVGHERVVIWSRTVEHSDRLTLDPPDPARDGILGESNPQLERLARMLRCEYVMWFHRLTFRDAQHETVFMRVAREKGRWKSNDKLKPAVRGPFLAYQAPPIREFCL